MWTRCFNGGFLPRRRPQLTAVRPPSWITAVRRVEQRYPRSQLPLAALWPSKRMEMSSNFNLNWEHPATSCRSTCVCFFGWGATDLEMLFTSRWTCVNIWFRFSTFSFFTALICEDKRYSRVAAATVSRPFKRLTCFSVVVTGFALFLCFRCLFATWKTVLVFFPFCLFFPISPEENTSTEVSTVSHLKTLGTWSLWVQVLNLLHHSDTLEHTLSHTHICNNA